MSVLRRLWQGKFSLPVAFWAFYAAGGIACFIVAGIIIVLGWETVFLGWSFDARPIARAIALVLIYGYLLLASVGVWRSASPSWASPIWLSRIWAAAARFVVAAWIAAIAFRLATGWASVLQWIMEGAAS
jgi:hypothetical protein